jgi:hypothetical protein
MQVIRYINRPLRWNLAQSGQTSQSSFCGLTCPLAAYAGIIPNPLTNLCSPFASIISSGPVHSLVIETPINFKTY